MWFSSYSFGALLARALLLGIVMKALASAHLSWREAQRGHMTGPVGMA